MIDPDKLQDLANMVVVRNHCRTLREGAYAGSFHADFKDILNETVKAMDEGFIVALKFELSK